MKLSEQGERRAAAQLDFLRSRPDLVVDADTHISDIPRAPEWIRERMAASPNYFHGKPIAAEELVAEMDAAGVDASLCWQNPAATVYSGDSDRDYDSLLAANRYIYESALQYPERIIPAGWTDPRALGIEGALRLVDQCVTEFGFAIIKINPAQNEFPIDSEQVFTVVERIYDRGAIPAFHFGADTPYTPPEGLARLAENFSPRPLFAIHMGGGGASYNGAEETYTKSREIGLENPNIHYILSAKRDTHIESDLIAYQLAGEPFSRNLHCASDAPYGRQSWNYGGFRAMFDSLMQPVRHTDPRLKENPGLFDKRAAAGYLGENFRTFMIEIYERFLKE